VSQTRLLAAAASRAQNLATLSCGTADRNTLPAAELPPQSAEDRARKVASESCSYRALRGSHQLHQHANQTLASEGPTNSGLAIEARQQSQRFHLKPISPIERRREERRSYFILSRRHFARTTNPTHLKPARASNQSGLVVNGAPQVEYQCECILLLLFLLLALLGGATLPLAQLFLSRPGHHVGRQLHRGPNRDQNRNRSRSRNRNRKLAKWELERLHHLWRPIPFPSDNNNNNKSLTRAPSADCFLIQPNSSSRRR